MQAEQLGPQPGLGTGGEVDDELYRSDAFRMQHMKVRGLGGLSRACAGLKP